jgi:hypothetical protein
MDSDSPSSPANETRSLIANGKRRWTTKVKAFCSQTKNLAKGVGGSSKETSATIPSSTKCKNPHGQHLAGQRLVLKIKDMVIPTEAMLSIHFDNKRSWGTSIKNLTGGNGQQKTGHLTATEIAAKRSTWKSLLNKQYLGSASRNLRSEGRRRGVQFHLTQRLRAKLVSTRFSELETKLFARNPSFVVISLP